MSFAGQIQAVTFDVGGTLMEPHPSVGHVYAEVAGRHGLTGISAELLNRRFAVAWRGLKDFNHTRSEWAELVDTTFHGLTDAPPSGTFFPELYFQFARPEAWRVFEDVSPTLDALATRGLKLGVISNWDERLRPLLRQLRLYDFFDSIVVSCEVGFPKPSPAIFQHTAAKLGLPPEAILHVGDSLVMDVQGGRVTGFHAVELCRRAGQAGPGQIKSLSEIEALVESRRT